MHPGLVIDRDAARVEVAARVACTRGFLEQVCCARGTRDHESLLVCDVPASAVQSALLAAGLVPGRPGSWTEAAGRIDRVAPAGDRIEVLVRVPGVGSAREGPIADWLLDASPEAPQARFVFAGSRFAATPQGERFAADLSGSIVGLVTFGDEVVALAEVVPDRVEAAPPRWRARGAVMPPEDTPVTLVLRRPSAAGL